MHFFFHSTGARMNRLSLFLLAISLILVAGCDANRADYDLSLNLLEPRPHGRDTLSGSIRVHLRAEPRLAVKYVRVQLNEVSPDRYHPPKRVLYDWTIWNEPGQRLDSGNTIVIDTTLSLPDGLVLVPLTPPQDPSSARYHFNVKISDGDNGTGTGRLFAVLE